MKLWIDDIRDAPDDSWTVVRSCNKALLDYIYDYAIIEEISFDHDMGENEPTGYDLLCRIERHIAFGYFYGLKNTQFSIHSANPVGRANMERAIYSIERYRNKAK